MTGRSPAVSVVVTTFQRPDACVRAVHSALAQHPEPLEVLICDDGSMDRTPDVMREIEARHARVRYLRTSRNTGTPGPGRTMGVEAASAEWVAFLDDDDIFLPGKLARQVERATAGGVDVIGTNGLLSDGSPYFQETGGEWRPTRSDILRDNPLIVSSVIARREMLLAAGEFRRERWARGVADYAMWLRLADLGARFAVLGEPLIEYATAGAERMSSRRATQELAVARMSWSRWRRDPADLALIRTAIGKTLAAARIAIDR